VPIVSAKTKAEIAKAEKEVEHEIESATIETSPSGVILKTDTLGSLEAIAHMLKSARVPIQRAEIGNINKNDVADSASNLEKNPALAFVLGFNVRVDEDAKRLADERNVTVIAEKIIYHLIDKYEEKAMNIKSDLEKKKLEGLVWPCKLHVLKGYVFRASKPAVFGVEILAGKLKTKAEFLTKDGKEIGEVKGIEVEKEKMTEVGAGKQAAISVDGVTVGRQINEGDTLYVAMTEENFRKLKAQKDKLNKTEIDALKEIAEIKRKVGKGTWGI
jgi:translation initiation factor 5B